MNDVNAPVTLKKQIVKAPVFVGRVGKSAYKVAVANGFVGDEAAWLASLSVPQATVTSMTAAELAALKLAQGVKVGQKYLLTDLLTQTIDYYGDLVPKFVDSTFLLTGTGPNALDVNVASADFPQDIIYFDTSDADPASWTVTYRKDRLKNLAAHYDYRVVKWRRWETVEGNGTYLSRVDTGFAYRDFYTFGNNIVFWTNTFVPASDGNGAMAGDLPRDRATELQVDSTNTVFGYNCFNNTIGPECSNNTIGNGFAYNIIGTEFKNNQIESEFYYNRVANFFTNNFTNYDFGYNDIGFDFGGNVIGESFWGNVIANQFQNNTIDNYFYGNVISAEFGGNLIGAGFEAVHSAAPVTNVNFTAATIVYTSHTKEIITNGAGVKRLRYTNASDNLIVTNLTA